MQGVAANPPTAVSLGSNTAKSITAGEDHTCAILNDNSMKCWGKNDVGQLGLGNTLTDALYNTPQAVSLSSNTVKAIVAGNSHTCAILNDNSVKCWGKNDVGQLGLGNTKTDASYDTPQAVGLGSTAKVITAGDYHTCATLNDDSVKCWGKNDVGQLGLGNTKTDASYDTPQAVSLGSTAKVIAAGGSHTCATLNNDSVKCWGKNDGGQLGLGNTTNSSTPQAVNLGTSLRATFITAGYDHTCAIFRSDKVKCWGQNFYGALGLGDHTTFNGYGQNFRITDNKNRGDAVDEMGDDLDFVSLGSDIMGIAGGSSYTCAIFRDHSVKCWGIMGMASWEKVESAKVLHLKM